VRFPIHFMYCRSLMLSGFFSVSSTSLTFIGGLSAFMPSKACRLMKIILPLYIEIYTPVTYKYCVRTYTCLYL
jgi:hypothetical protein